MEVARSPPTMARACKNNNINNDTKKPKFMSSRLYNCTAQRWQPEYYKQVTISKFNLFGETEIKAKYASTGQQTQPKASMVFVK